MAEDAAVPLRLVIVIEVPPLAARLDRPLVLVVGMLSSKDCEGFLRNFTGLARRIIAVPIPNQKNALPPDSIARQIAQRPS